MTRLRAQTGQATVMLVLFLVAFVGITAAVLDVGAWFRADRKLQANSDAAALAGAQELPDNPGAALAQAVDYGDLNGGDVGADDITFETTVVPNDTIVVDTERDAPGVFTGLFGIDSVEVHAKAKARAGAPSEAMYVAPIVVNEKHPLLLCKPKPCFDDPTMLEYHHLKEHGPSEPDGAGSFGFINLTGEDNPGTSQLRDQILTGWDQSMPLGNYNARTGNPFSAIHDALEERIGDEMLFPVYRKLTGTGSGAKYDIIGWVGFVITDMELHGSNEKLYGHFTRVIWSGLLSETPSETDFGVTVIALVE
jgi:Putative Flp pilus-assembly TadE/G-like